MPRRAPRPRAGPYVRLRVIDNGTGIRRRCARTCSSRSSRPRNRQGHGPRPRVGLRHRPPEQRVHRRRQPGVGRHDLHAVFSGDRRQGAGTGSAGRLRPRDGSPGRGRGRRARRHRRAARAARVSRDRGGDAAARARDLPASRRRDRVAADRHRDAGHERTGARAAAVSAKPGLRILFISGYAEAAKSALSGPNISFLAKPFRASALTR